MVRVETEKSFLTWLEERGWGLNGGEIRPAISYNERSTVLIFAIIGFLLSAFFLVGMERVSGDAEEEFYKENYD